MDRWWDPSGAAMTPDGADLALLEPGEDAQQDLGLAFMAMHRAGAAACRAVAQQPIPDGYALVQALAVARGAFAEPLVDSVSKSLQDEPYAGLLVADVLDEAEEAALAVFTAAVSKGVAAPLAAERAGMVYGTPKTALSSYLPLATDPRAHPTALTDAADRALFGYFAALSEQEWSAHREPVSKATREREPARTGIDLNALFQQAEQAHGAVTPDNPETPYYDARNASGEFAPATEAGGEDRVNIRDLLRTRRATGGGQVAPERVGEQAPAQTPGRLRQTRTTRQTRKTRSTRPSTTPAPTQTRSQDRTSSREPSRELSRERSARVRDLTRVSSQRAIEIAHGTPAPSSAPAQVRENWLAMPRPNDTTPYARREVDMSLVAPAWMGRNAIKSMVGKDKRFRLGHLADALETRAAETGTGDHEDLIRLAANQEEDSATGQLLHVEFTPDELDAVQQETGSVDAYMDRKSRAMVEKYMAEEMGLRPGDRGFEAQRQILEDSLTPAANRYEDDDGYDDSSVFRVLRPETMHADTSLHEFHIRGEARAVDEGSPKYRDLHLDPNQVYRLSEAPLRQVYDPTVKMWRTRWEIIPVHNGDDHDYRVGKADARSRTQAHALQALFDQAKAAHGDDPSTPYYDAREANGRFAPAVSQRSGVTASQDKTYIRDVLAEGAEVRTTRQSRSTRKTRQTRSTPARTPSRERSASAQRENARSRRDSARIPLRQLKRLQSAQQEYQRDKAAATPALPDMPTLHEERTYTVLSPETWNKITTQLGWYEDDPAPASTEIYGMAKQYLLTVKPVSGDDADKEMRHLTEELVQAQDVPPVVVMREVARPNDHDDSYYEFNRLLDEQFAQNPDLASLVVDWVPESDRMVEAGDEDWDSLEYPGDEKGAQGLGEYVVYGNGAPIKPLVLIEHEDELDLTGPLRLVYRGTFRANELPREGIEPGDPWSDDYTQRPIGTALNVFKLTGPTAHIYRAERDAEHYDPYASDLADEAQTLPPPPPRRREPKRG